MKPVLFFRNNFSLFVITGLFLFFAISCGQVKNDSTSNSETEDKPSSQDSSPAGGEIMPAPVTGEDTVVFKNDSAVQIPPPQPPALPEVNIPENPATIPPEMKIAKGVAMVYCPAKMIDGLPSIVNATLTQEDINTALIEFGHKIGAENPETSGKEIEKNIKSETIDLYENMAVKLEFDPDLFKISPRESIVTKSFGDKKQLDWEWDITPLHTTERSYIHFKFYYADTKNNTLQEILDKRISVDVKVDNRAFLDKWKTFLLGDPKTTTTAILIPLATFLGGFLTGKKNKKAT